MREKLPTRVLLQLSLIPIYWMMVVALAVTEVTAQQFPVRRYDTANGLANLGVRVVYQDRKGYLWFGTSDGLSRFDGYEFTNYGPRDGLDFPVINSIVEDRQGRLWVGTWGNGVARLLDQPDSSNDGLKKFVSYRIDKTRGSNEVSEILIDSEDAIWCLTTDGVYKARTGPNDPEFGLVIHGQARAMTADDKGRIWIATYKDLVQVSQNGATRYPYFPKAAGSGVVSIVNYQNANVLVVHQQGIFLFNPPKFPDSSSVDGLVVSSTATSGVWTELPMTLARDERIATAMSDPSGSLWIATSKGVVKWEKGKQTRYENQQLGIEARVISLFNDIEQNLWIGTERGVICKVSGETIVNFTTADGLPDHNVVKVLEDSQGNIFASTAKGIVQLVNGRGVAIAGSQTTPFNYIGRAIIQDQRGDWWVGTQTGLYHFIGPRLQFRHGRKFTLSDGIPESGIFNETAIHESSNGEIWVSLGGNLYVFRGHENKPSFARVVLKDPSVAIPETVVSILRDRAGAVWLASYSGLGRLADGKLDMIPARQGLPDTQVRSMLSDSQGRLWFGLRYKGVSMVEDPTANPVAFINYSTENGLGNDLVRAIAEDDFGLMYFATNRGLDQLNPATGNIRHFTTANGLAGDLVWSCIKDKRGYIWAATQTGLSRLDPRAHASEKTAPPVYLSRILIAGQDLPLPERGTVQIPAITLRPTQNNLQVEFVGVSFQAGPPLRYQYKLENTQADWSVPIEQRSLNFAQLSPGKYRLLVRAVSGEGRVSVQPAILELQILPPIWQRWWFVSLAVALVAAAVYSMYRYRLTRLVELERVRTRIATDLHDDIGSNLSRIAILSEVAIHQADRTNQRMTGSLSLISTVSRELVDSMSDIVWAINPNKDNLGDLTQRMMRFASDIFTAKNIEFSFHSSGGEADSRVAPDVRRQVFLIFKESINNAVRHSQCTKAEIDLRIAAAWLTLIVKDNGRGFDPTRIDEGNGLKSMNTRARSLGGELDIVTKLGTGTTVTVKLPLVGTLGKSRYGVR